MLFSALGVFKPIIPRVNDKIRMYLFTDIDENSTKLGFKVVLDLDVYLIQQSITTPGYCLFNVTPS